ncbi:cytochrome P450 [Tanacetum coccineum]
MFSSIAENWDRVLIPEECSSRQFNRSLGKECVLTTQMNFIKEMVHAPIGNESIPVRVLEVDDDIENGDDSGEDSDMNSEEEDGPLGATNNEDTFLENVGVPRNSLTVVHISFLKKGRHQILENKSKTKPTTYMSVHTTLVNVCDTEASVTLHKKERYASLRLIDPLNGIAPLPRKKKAATSTILNPNPGRFSQPSKPTSSPSPDAISDSLSLSGCCNQQILSNPINDSDTESLEVNKTIKVGNALGFILSLRGFGEDHKRSWVRRLCLENKIHFLGLQESMSNEDNRFLIQSMWGHSTFDYALNKANGKSGGIVAIWDTSKFHMTSSIIGDGFLALTGKWLSIDIDCLFIVVYAPHALNRKKKLWLDIEALVQSQNCLSPRLTNGRWPNSHTLALTREFSDHSPIILINSVNDYGPTPFRFYNSWLHHNDFSTITNDSWSTFINRHSSNPAIKFKLKLKHLIFNLKNWRRSINATESAAAIELREKIDEIDRRAELSPLSAIDVDVRIEKVKLLAEMDHRKLKDLRQKS